MSLAVQTLAVRHCAARAPCPAALVIPDNLEDFADVMPQLQALQTGDCQYERIVVTIRCEELLQGGLVRYRGCSEFSGLGRSRSNWARRLGLPVPTQAPAAS